MSVTAATAAREILTGNLLTWILILLVIALLSFVRVSPDTEAA